MATEEERIDIIADLTDRVSRPAKKIEKSIAGIGDEAEDSSAASSRLEGRLNRMGATSQRLAGRVNKLSFKRISKEVRELDGDLGRTDRKMNRFAGTVGKFGRGLSSLGRGVGSIMKWMFRGGGSSGGGGGGGGMGLMGILGKGGGVGAIVSIIAKIVSMSAVIAAIGALIPSLVTGVSALGAVVVASVGPLLQLGAGLAYLVPLMAAAAGSAALIGIGLGGIGEAAFSEDAEERAEAMKKLSQNGREFVGVLRDMNLREQFKGIASGIQDAMLDGEFREAFKETATKWMPMLRKDSTIFGRALGDTMEEWLRTLGKPSVMRNVDELLKSSARSSKVIGGALGSFGEGGLKVINAALPSFERLSGSAAKSIDKWASNLDDKELENFFSKVESRVRTTVKWAGNVGTMLKNLTGSANPLTDYLGESIGGLLGKGAAWSSKPENQKKMEDWFKKQIPNVKAIGNLIGSVSTEIGKMSTSENFAPFINKVSDEFLPAFGDMLMKLDRDLMPSITSIVGSLGEGMQSEGFDVAISNLKTIFEDIAGFLTWYNGVMNSEFGKNVTKHGVGGLFMPSSYQDPKKEQAKKPVSPPVQFGNPNAGLFKSPTLPGINTNSLNAFGPQIQQKVQAPLDNAQKKFNMFGNAATAQNQKINGLSGATGLFSSQAQGAAGKADRLSGAIQKIPSSKKITVTADTSQAQGAINKVITDNNGRRIVLTVDTATGSTTALRPVGGGFDTAMATGGPTWPGLTALVGEAGKEGFLDRAGKMSMIGQNGPEIRKFSKSGYVVPNDMLGDVQSAMSNAQGGRRGAFGKGLGPNTRGGSSGAGEGGSVMPPVHVEVHGNVDSEVDIERAVRNGIRRAQKEARERR